MHQLCVDLTEPQLVQSIMFMLMPGGTCSIPEGLRIKLLQHLTLVQHQS